MSDKRFFSDLAGKRFGRLMVRYPIGQSRNRSRIWHCECDCGGSVDATARDLNRGAVRSCGCLKHKPPAEFHRIKNNLHFVDGTCIENLIASQRRPVINKTGVRGVYPARGGDAYVATIGFKGKTHYLGKFKTLGEAAAARKSAEQEMYGGFLRQYCGAADLIDKSPR